MNAGTSAKDRWVRWGILIIGSAIILAIFYGSGMRAQTKRLQAINEQRKVAEQNYRDAQREQRIRLAVAQQLEGRRQASLALLELDKRNFGAAQERLSEASKRLQAANVADSSVPNLAAIAEKFGAINLVATPDTGAQRTTILALVDEMDKAMTDFTPDFLNRSVAADTANPIKKPTMNDVPLPPAMGNDVTRVK